MLVPKDKSFVKVNTSVRPAQLSWRILIRE